MAHHVVVNLTQKEARCLYIAAQSALDSDEDAMAIFADDRHDVSAAYRALEKLNSARA
jgi:hypothetical protein